MATSQVEATAAELLAGLPQRLGQVFRSWAKSAPAETRTLESACINPRRKIPVLRDGDLTIAESPAIVAYLSETYGTIGNTLIPRDRRQRAQWLEWCFHIAMELDATGLYVMRRHAAHDLPGLGGQLRRSRAAALHRLHRPHRAAAGLSGGTARQPATSSVGEGEPG